MNTKIYKAVFALANELMSCANKKNQAGFDEHYAQLKKICEDNDKTEKDHPVQWETLADFTDDIELAIAIYGKALAKAETINSKDYLSSIGYSMACLQAEFGDTAGAIASLEKAKINSNKIIDKELKADIHDRLKELQDA
ncbi:tetratricopeptide repeat protein [Marinomonas pollencensis]|uniref:Replicative DNA helicase n=1 Tax=Marinomonas pollencensis TaxID=491954 RepID=A0A3E0DN91_9GAMM|nr:tetratricopeptide repeat protein [Marinomonas pollencensis]REG84307.1 hypothetical protein DFP81_104186 [Marinomonas pollencensis]